MEKTQEKFPKETIRLNEDEISTDMASIHIEDIELPEGVTPLLKRRMRCRVLECRPGGVIATHSHINRPAILYVLEGQGEEHSNQFEGIKIWKEGDCFSEYNNVEHWVKNRSDKTPLKVLTFDLFDDFQTKKHGSDQCKKDSGC